MLLLLLAVIFAGAPDSVNAQQGAPFGIRRWAERLLATQFTIQRRAPICIFARSTHLSAPPPRIVFNMLENLSPAASVYVPITGKQHNQKYPATDPRDKGRASTVRVTLPVIACPAPPLSAMINSFSADNQCDRAPVQCFRRSTTTVAHASSQRRGARSGYPRVEGNASTYSSPESLHRLTQSVYPNMLTLLRADGCPSGRWHIPWTKH